jgi:hypothetical protein
MTARENLIVVLGQVFHFKLGCFYVVKEVHDANECPCLKLKTQSKFCPANVSFSLPSMEGGGQCPLSLPQVPFLPIFMPLSLYTLSPFEKGVHVNQCDRFP